MRVLLIRPNSKMRTAFMPLGIGYIASAIRREGHEVSLLDARLWRLSPAKVAECVRDIGPDIIGLSAIHYEKQDVRKVANTLRRDGVKAPIVLGGPLVSTMGEKLLEDRTADAAVIGEGETTFVNYLKAQEKGDRIDTIPGLIHLIDGVARSNPVNSYLDDIDGLVPAWDLIGPEQYFKMSSRHTHNQLIRSPRSVSIFTSRGCPFGCIYCHNVFGKRFRARSASAVLEEISMLKHEYGIRELEIVDDCFNLDLERAKEIARGIVSRKLNLWISFSNGLRADRMDEELIDLLKEAGTYRINYAVETASPRLQKLIGKNLDLDYTRDVISYTAARGIFTFGYFMLGFPTETEDEMQMTRDYALHSRLHAANFFYVNPFPGTALAERYMPSGWNPSDIDNMDYYDFKLNLSEVSDETLRRLKKEAFRKLHFSPYRMWRAFRVVPRNMRTFWAVGITVILSIKDKGNW